MITVHRTRPEGTRAQRLLRRSVVAVVLVSSVAAGGPASPTSAAPCFTADAVAATSYVSGVAVGSESGTVWYSNMRRGSYRVTVTDHRLNGAGLRLFVQFRQTGQSYWKERVQSSVVRDGGRVTFTGTFNKGYDIAEVSFGVGQVGAPTYTIAWDRNSPCGA